MKREEQAFKTLCTDVFQQLEADEELTLQLSGELTLFLRFNQSKVRQASQVEQWDLTITYKRLQRSCSYALQVSADLHNHRQCLRDALKNLRAEAQQLADDPVAGPVVDHGTSSMALTGNLPDVDRLLEEVQPLLLEIDFVGLYTGGPAFRGIANSKGSLHWFQNESFVFDYSIYEGDRAVKGCYAGDEWQQSALAAQLRRNTEQLRLLRKPRLPIAPGNYRCFLAPSAVAEIAALLGWGGLGAGGYRRGECALQRLVDGETALSPMLNVAEDFSLGHAPRFNSECALAPEKLSLINNGQLAELLVSARSAREYELTSNGADDAEMPRSLVMDTGTLEEDNIAARLGRGIYIANVHYLNWSDLQGARFTGMTRFACFWVEDGEIVGPIEDLRFDDTFYRCFGDQLEALTRTSEIQPTVLTYGNRHLGASRVPGILVSNMAFTL